MTPETPALEASEPVPQKYKWRLSLWVGISFTIVSLLVWPGAGPFFEVYDQIKVPMPPATETLKSLHQIIVGYPAGWIFLGFVATFAAGFVEPRRARTASTVALFVTIVLLLWILWALFSPLIVLLEGIGRRR